MPNKSLGQHWLKDRFVLDAIADDAEIGSEDIVLEIGPGQGTLTSVLLNRAKRVISVEFDEELAKKLPGQFPGKNLQVISQDILQFDDAMLPDNYKLVANVPYYITSKIINKFMTSSNPPSVAVLLIQKEVAERVTAGVGDMSILAISAQVYAEVSLGDVVPAELFTPPPKVDSQVLILKTRPKPLVAKEDEKLFFRVVKAGFSAKRKKLRSSLSGGLGLPKDEVGALLNKSGIDPDLRAEALSIDQWLELAKAYRS